jgi:cyclophilin family peptidyl-prolyl cis-trans isomerase
MANSGKRNTNTSQFFFTLDKADELTNKHTLFGKVVGNTIYSEFNSTLIQMKEWQLMIDLMDLSQLDVDENERPVKFVLSSHSSKIKLMIAHQRSRQSESWKTRSKISYPGSRLLKSVLNKKRN